MLNDYYASLANGLAYGGTPSVVDLGSTMGALGTSVRLYVQGHGLAGVTAIVLNDGTTTSPATLRMTLQATAAEINAGPIVIALPSNFQRYFTIALTAASAGTYDAWICLENAQTNK